MVAQGILRLNGRLLAGSACSAKGAYRQSHENEAEEKREAARNHRQGAFDFCTTEQCWQARQPAGAAGDGQDCQCSSAMHGMLAGLGQQSDESSDEEGCAEDSRHQHRDARRIADHPAHDAQNNKQQAEGAGDDRHVFTLG